LHDQEGQPQCIETVAVTGRPVQLDHQTYQLVVIGHQKPSAVNEAQPG
jgi:hypothetical protein